jgi:predicted Rossmann fold nucleotide-binding protein DprA/Smf involved in DNA uptake
VTDTELALRAAINVLRDTIESGRMPSRLKLTPETAALHERAARHLEAMLARLANQPAPDPSDRRFTGLLVDYLRRMPASVANVASHFGMSEAHAKDALWSLEQAGLAHKSGRSEWSVSDG